MSDRLKMPPEQDYGFYQRRKHDKWRAVEVPEGLRAAVAAGARIADTHAHVHMLPDPAWELARCAANGVDFVCMIVDPTEDGTRPFDELDAWIADAARHVGESNDRAILDSPRVPAVRVATGVHPHNAKLYDAAVERDLEQRLADPRVTALGEIGLDFHYDLSPREVQREVFIRQIRLAKQTGLPVSLHLRGGEDPVADNAHAEAFAILQQEGFPQGGTLLHCCSLPPDELAPWVEAGCYIAYGGALTFKNAEDARAGACDVPLDRLLVETDAPYMTPEPMRGAACTPAHVVFTAALLADLRAQDVSSRAVLDALHENALRLLDR